MVHRADDSSFIFKTNPSFQESWKIMLKQLRTLLFQVTLKGNVNVIAVDYTAATQDTHRETERGKDVMLTSVTSLIVTT